MEPGTCIVESTNSAAAYTDPGDAPIYAHYPAKLRIGGNLSKDMGELIKIPMAFQGLTRKEARTREVPECDFTKKEGTLREDWKRWNESSEHYLGQNTVSAPQDNSEGFAITADMRRQQLTLDIMRKHMILVNQ
eukprot:5989682-Heterocapsa_arctica.AAC.1